MSRIDDLLKDLKYFSMNEDSFEKKREATRLKDNYIKILQKMKREKEHILHSSDFTTNLDKARKSVQAFKISHITNIHNLLNIIKTGELLAPQKLLEKDYDYNSTGPFYMMEIKNLHIIATIHPGDWIYGMYEIVFKREVENLPGAKFLPQGCIHYHPQLIKNYLMDIKNWREYIAQYITLNLIDPIMFIAKTPVDQRPEFLFYERIPVSYIESINCATEKACTELKERIKESLRGKKEILNLIKKAD